MTKPRKGTDGWREGRGQVGIDGNRDVDFTKRNRSPAWNVQSVHSEKPNYPGKYSVNESGLRNKMPDEDPQQGNTRRGGGKDIFDNVERNSGDVSETGGTGPIKYGVD